MTGRVRAAAVLAAGAGLAAGPAAAHLVRGEALGFAAGALHPLSGADHVIAMVAVGLWGATLGPPALYLLPIAFPLVMAVGGFLGLVGVALPGGEIAIALSGLCLGAAVALEWRAPPALAAGLVGLFGLFHGYAHGRELPAGADALLYSLGFVLATGALHAAGVALGTLRATGPGRGAVRGLGAAIAAGGAVFLWRALR